MKTLQSTLSNIFQKAALSQKTLDKHFLTPSSMRLFEQSLTTKDYNTQFNLETLEAKGDVMVNMVATTYTLNKYPKVKSLKWKAKLQHNLFGTKSLAHAADILGLSLHIHHKGGPLTLLIKEDVVEAFIGVIGTICGDNISAYYSISYSILSWCYDRMPFINLNYKEQFDALSRLKELYDAHQMVFKKGTTSSLRNGTFEKIFIIPLNPPIKVCEIGQTEQHAEQQASLKALKILEEKGLKENIPNPFDSSLRPKKDAVVLETLPNIPPNFESKVLEYFSSMSDKVGEVVKLNIDNLLRCFFDSKYYIGVNAADEKFVGVSVVDLIAVEYIFEHEKGLNPKKVMTLKHSLANGPLYVEALRGLKEFVQTPIKLIQEEHLELSKSSFKAFVGATFSLFNSSFGEGAGLAIWRALLFPQIRKNPPSLSFKHPLVLLNEKFPKGVKVVEKEVDKLVDGETERWWNIVIFVDGKKVSEVEGAGKKIMKNRAATEAVKTLKL